MALSLSTFLEGECNFLVNQHLCGYSGMYLFRCRRNEKRREGGGTHPHLCSSSRPRRRKNVVDDNFHAQHGACSH
jgi:hypothetical protein